MTMRRIPVVVATLLGVCGGLPAAAPADAGLSLAVAPAARFPQRAMVLTLPSSRVLDPASVRVSENGHGVRDLRLVPGGKAGPRTFGVVLVIDTSLSMRGKPVVDAMAAARAFAADRPPNEQLGVVFFSAKPTVGLVPTTDAAKIQQVLAAPPLLSRGTRIFDATSAALQLLAQAHVRVGSVVVLSDGADTGSAVGEGAVSSAASRTHVRIFTVGLRSQSFRSRVLAQLATGANGTYAEATSSDQLAPIFTALSRRLGREYLVRYTSLAPIATRVNVEARVAGVAGVATTTYESPAIVLPRARAHVSAAGPWASTGVAIAVVALVAGALGMAVFLLIRPRVRTVRERIAGFVPPKQNFADELLQSVAAQPGAGRDEGRLGRSRLWQSFLEDIDVGKIEIRPVVLAGGLVMTTVVFLMFGVALGNVGIVLLAFAVPALGRWLVRFKADRQRRAFEDEMADNLQVLASAMRAGHAFISAMAVAADDAGEPTKTELLRVVRDEQLGVPLEEAVRRVALRMRSADFEYVGLVAALQRETGGNTAEVIDRVTDTIRERAALRRMVRSLTAQGRFSGGVVSLLPVGLAAFIATAQPNYFNDLLASGFGRLLLFGAGALVIVGWLTIRRIVDIKV